MAKQNIEGFDLSEKINEFGRLESKDVREFIRMRDKLDWDLYSGKLSWCEYRLMANKLAGKKLCTD